MGWIWIHGQVQEMLSDFITIARLDVFQHLCQFLRDYAWILFKTKNKKKVYEVS